MCVTEGWAQRLLFLRHVVVNVDCYPYRYSYSWSHPEGKQLNTPVVGYSHLVASWAWLGGIVLFRLTEGRRLAVKVSGTTQQSGKERVG